MTDTAEMLAAARFLPTFDTPEEDRAHQRQRLGASRITVGGSVDIPHDMAALTHSQGGCRIALWFGFQPMYQEIVADQPDLLS